MKIREAIDILEIIRENIDRPTEKVSVGLAITALTGAIEALEKQLPKEIKAINPERSEESGDVEFCCPNCNSHYLCDITDVPNYCPECGIRFDT